MKKFLTLTICSLFMLFSGVLLASCDSANYFISFVFEEPEFVTASVLADKQEVKANSSGKFQVRENSEIQVWFYAKQHGVDMRNLVVKANNEQRNEIYTFNNNYEPLKQDGGLKYGYILFKGLKENVTISVSGAESYKNHIVFKVDNLEDESVAARLNNASIKIPGEEDFVNFYDFLNGDDKSFDIDLVGQDEGAGAFQMQFKGGNPYVINAESPFKIQYQNGTEEPTTKALDYPTYDGGTYTFSLGNLENNLEVTLLTDFGSLKLMDFPLYIQKNNKTFETTFEILQDPETSEPSAPGEANVAALKEAPSTFNFESSAKIKFKKLLQDVDYSNLKCFVNDLELEQDPDAENAEDEITYLVPTGLTPESTGGEDSYDLCFKGIDYGEKKTISLKASTAETHPIKLIVPDFSTVDENGEQDVVAGYDDEGNMIVFEGTKTSLDWEYPSVGEKYITPYKLYDYNLYINGEIVLNVADILSGNEDKAGQDLEISFENGNVFKAIFNETTQKYDKFHFEFVPEGDMEFIFNDFQLQEKSVFVSFDFDLVDERVSGVQFAIDSAQVGADQISSWTDLSRGVAVQRTMSFGQVLYFKLKAEGDVKLLGKGRWFILQNTIANDNRKLDAEELSEEDGDYLVVKFPLSDFYFDTPEEMKLVSAGSQELG